MKNLIMVDKIRENFVSKFVSSPLTLDEFVFEYEDRIYTILDNEELDSFKLYTYMELMVAYSDFFKLMSIRKKQNLATLDDYYNLYSSDYIQNLNDLMTEISSTPSFLEKILKSMYEFYMLSYLGRSNAYRSLSEDENIYLSNFSSLFDEEKEYYKKDVELDDYLSHFKIKQEMMEEYLILNPEYIISEICGFIVDLSKYNYENYINNVKDLLIFYYEWVKYDVMHEKTLLSEKIEEKEEFIMQFENLDFEELGHYILYDSNFLFFLVDFYCAAKENNCLYYKDGRKLEYKEVEEYIQNIEDKKVKEKVKYKKTRI